MTLSKGFMAKRGTYEMTRSWYFLLRVRRF